MNALEVLVAAREKLATPERWTKGTWGRDGKGEPLPVSRLRAATCHCVAGAVLVSDPTRGRAAHEARLLLREVIGRYNIGAWNDAPERTHAEVLDALDRAIELARGGGR